MFLCLRLSRRYGSGVTCAKYNVVTARDFMRKANVKKGNKGDCDVNRINWMKVLGVKLSENCCTNLTVFECF